MNANFGAAFLTSSPHASKNIIMVAGTAITLAVAVSYYQKKRVPKEKEEDSWLDSEGYEVVESICDTFLPEITLVGNGDLHLLVKETLRDEFNLSESNMSLFESNEVMSHKAHLLRGALSSNVPQQVKKAVQNLSYKREQQRVFQFVKILSYSAGCWLLFGIPTPFPKMSPVQRRQALLQLRDSSIGDLRAAYQTFRRLIGFIFLADSDSADGSTAATGYNPFWSHIGYDPQETKSKALSMKDLGITRKVEQEYGKILGYEDDGAGTANASGKVEEDRTYGASLKQLMQYRSTIEKLRQSPSPSPSPVPIPVDPTTTTSTDEITVDAVVIGSGAGGGMMAKELYKQGYTVVVLEKGGYYNYEDFQKWQESQAMLGLYEQGGLCVSEDGNIVILAGSCVGGGTTVNWSASFRTPDAVLDEWTQQGMPQFRRDANSPFQQSLNTVHSQLGINTNCSYTPPPISPIPPMSNDDKTCKGASSEGASSASDTDKCSGSTFVTNDNNRLLWRGAEAMGMEPQLIPRNVEDCVDCGHCCFGCPYGAKKSTVRVFIEPAMMEQYRLGSGDSGYKGAKGHKVKKGEKGDMEDKGDKGCREGKKGSLHVIPDCMVDRVMLADTRFLPSSTHGKRAIGVCATVRLYTTDQDRSEKKPSEIRSLVIHSKVVISCAGSIHTPALLLRSGLKHPKIGRHLSLHPVLGAQGLFTNALTVGAASGVSMGVVVPSIPPPIPHTPYTTPDPYTVRYVDTSGKEHKDNTQQRIQQSYERVNHQTPPMHPGVLGMITPWTSGLQHKILSLTWSTAGLFISIPRDKSSPNNRITIDSEGHPIITYKITEEDKGPLMDGLCGTIRLMHAAGAMGILTSHENMSIYYRGEGKGEGGGGGGNGDTEEQEALERYISKVRAEGIKPSSMQVFSAHQMSSCRMAANPKDGPVAPTGELYECHSLFVADGSALPTSLGINPMVTIEAMSHMISIEVVKHLQKMKKREKDERVGYNEGYHSLDLSPRP